MLGRSDTIGGELAVHCDRWLALLGGSCKDIYLKRNMASNTKKEKFSKNNTDTACFQKGDKENSNTKKRWFVFLCPQEMVCGMCEVCRGARRRAKRRSQGAGDMNWGAGGVAELGGRDKGRWEIAAWGATSGGRQWGRQG